MPAERNGFTLVEVLVALVVTSLLLAVVMNGAIDARRRAAASADKKAALVLAEALIAERGAAPFDAAPAAGREGRLSWSVAERSLAADPRGLFSLAEIEVTVASASAVRLVRLTARKLKPVPRP